VIQKKLILVALCVILTSCNNVFLKLMNSNSPDREQSRFIVVFDKNGGEKEASPNRKTINLPENTIGILPFPPERNEYTFAGWNTSADGSGAIFDDVFIITENIIVFAQWQQN
jgi:uncharacterized repeat protein (TIGR02543 family)